MGVFLSRSHVWGNQCDVMRTRCAIRCFTLYKWPALVVPEVGGSSRCTSPLCICPLTHGGHSARSHVWSNRCDVVLQPGYFRGEASPLSPTSCSSIPSRRGHSSMPLRLFAALWSMAFYSDDVCNIAATELSVVSRLDVLALMASSRCRQAAALACSCCSPHAAFLGGGQWLLWRARAARAARRVCCAATLALLAIAESLLPPSSMPHYSMAGSGCFAALVLLASWVAPAALAQLPIAAGSLPPSPMPRFSVAACSYSRC